MIANNVSSNSYPDHPDERSTTVAVLTAVVDSG